MEILILGPQLSENERIYELIVKLGHQVTLVHTSQQAIEQSQSQIFDLIIIDISDLGANGLQVIESLKEIGAVSLFIVMTDLHSKEIELEARQAGIALYVIKETDIEDLELFIQHMNEKLQLKNSV